MSKSRLARHRPGMEDDVDLEKMPRWRLPKSVAPDAWLYYTRKGIEVYHDGRIVCVIPQRYVAMYARQRASLTDGSLSNE